MKNLLILTSACLLLGACADKTAQQKALLDDIIKVHDKVMSADEQLMNNKMKMDTVMKDKTAPDTSKSTRQLYQQVNSADVAMENWMHKFDPDYAAKPGNDAVTYFTAQKKQIMAIDSEMNIAVDQSNKYLSQIKKK